MAIAYLSRLDHQFQLRVGRSLALWNLVIREMQCSGKLQGLSEQLP